MHVEIVGLEETEKIIEVFADKARLAAFGAAEEEASYEFELTQELVPVRSGQLKASGRVESATMAGSEVTAAIAYGGPAGAGRNTQDVDYAERVHEDLEAEHPNGGQAKYVEAVVQGEEASGRTATRMAEGISRRLVQAGSFATKSGSYLRGALTGRFQGSRR